jgi:hypothetical protein
MGESRKSVLERLRVQVGPEKFNCYLPFYIEDIRALLAVVEAAQEYRHVQEYAVASKPDSPRRAGQRLDTALAALTSEQKPGKR